MDLWPTRGYESLCHPEPSAVTLSAAKGLQSAREASSRELSAVSDSRESSRSPNAESFRKEESWLSWSVFAKF